MPWREVCAMDEKLRFITAVLDEDANMSELCESFGIRGKTGYKWLARYRGHGSAGLRERSRAPHRVPWAIARAQGFERFRQEFNHQRPHEALNQRAPVTHYAPSPRRYPARLQDPVDPADYQVRRVRSNGEIKWRGEKIFVSAPLIGEVIGVKETENGPSEIYFGPIALGIIDPMTGKLKSHSRGRRGGQLSSRSTPSETENVLPMSPVVQLPQRGSLVS